MARQIKFRGKRADNGEWVYGYFVEDGFYTIWSHNEDDFLTQHLVDPDTVGQFTGLTDCNGKEIYEGDIVRYYDDIEDCLENGVVSYHDEWCSFNVDVPALGDPVGLAKHWSYEVIGNKFDNPSLLK